MPSPGEVVSTSRSWRSWPEPAVAMHKRRGKSGQQTPLQIGTLRRAGSRSADRTNCLDCKARVVSSSSSKELVFFRHHEPVIPCRLRAITLQDGVAVWMAKADIKGSQPGSVAKIS
jgi:hypothetical protein